MVRSEGNMSLKIPVKPPGIDPGTQRLNHYATPDPNEIYSEGKFFPITRHERKMGLRHSYIFSL